MLEWLTTPVCIYSFLAAGLGLSLVLFVSLKHELRSLQELCAGQDARLRELAAGMAEQHRSFEDRLREAEDRAASAPLAPAPSSTISGIHLNQRSQVIRMLRLGEPPEQIAASLNLSLREVELIAKVQRMLVESVA